MAEPTALVRRPDGLILHWSSGLAALYGWTAAEAYGRPVQALLDTRSPLSTAELAANLERDGRLTVVLDQRHRDGTRFGVLTRWDLERDGAGRPRAVFEIHARPGDAAGDQQALADSEARYRRLLDAIHDGVFIAQDERFVFCNRRLAELIGTDEATLLGQPFEQIVHPDMLDAFRQRFRARIGGLDPPANHETTFRRQDDGRSVPLLLHATRIEHDGGPAVLGTVADISERRRIEEQLRQSQKLEAIGQLTGGVAHDFNNMLAVIMGGLEIIGSELPTPALREMADLAFQAAMRGAELTQRLLAFGRRQALRPDTVDVGRLVLGLESMLRRTLGEVIFIEIALAPDLWRTTMDRSQLEMALVNLAINARDAMPRGGSLRIAAANVTVDEAAAQTDGGDLAAGAYVLVTVADSGTGMTPEVQAKALEPFFTTKEVGKGSGLGLSMVFGFVKQSGGHLKIDSEPGAGTTIALYLPRSTRDPAPATPAPAGPVGRAAETILIVEDEPQVLAFVLAALTSLGYRALTASSGADALALLQTGAAVDLMLCDMVLPGGMTGPEIAAAARRVRPRLKVLFMSGYPDVPAGDAGPALGSDPLIAKPFRRAELAARLREVLAAGPPAVA